MLEEEIVKLKVAIEELTRCLVENNKTQVSATENTVIQVNESLKPVKKTKKIGELVIPLDEEHDEVVSVMPAPPTFEAPVAEVPSFLSIPAAVAKAPFNTAPEMIAYVTRKYQELGAKGQQIQTVFTTLNCKGINDIRPAQYDDLYASIEAL